MIFSQMKQIYSFILTTPSKAIAGILVNGVKDWNKDNICWFPEKIKETLYLPLQVHFCERVFVCFYKLRYASIIFCGMNLTLNIPYNWFKNMLIYPLHRFLTCSLSVLCEERVCWKRPLGSYRLAYSNVWVFLAREAQCQWPNCPWQNTSTSPKCFMASNNIKRIHRDLCQHPRTSISMTTVVRAGGLFLLLIMFL